MIAKIFWIVFFGLLCMNIGAQLAYWENGRRAAMQANVGAGFKPALELQNPNRRCEGHLAGGE